MLHVRLARRGFLQVGALGAGLTLSQLLRLTQAGATTSERSGILVFLRGGPSHQDTFDLKPDAPVEYRGAFRPTATNVPGVAICEHLPQLARCAQCYAIVRHITHNLADHGLGSRYLLTGNRPGAALQYPAYGAVVQHERRCRADLPAYVAVDDEIEGPGFLGAGYAALATGEKPRADRPVSVRGLTIEGDQGQARRRKLVEDLDTAFAGHAQLDEAVASLDRFSRQAHDILNSPRTRAAFDVSQERRELRERFGPSETGQSLLLACRLIEAGVRFVTVVVDNWDTHNNNFTTLRNDLLPRFDKGLSGLLETLHEKGLLATTAVLITGEFGRTPRVNGSAGRDHWARAMFALFAGGAVKGGQVLGATDAHAAEPKGAACSPDDVAASFYHNLGIDPHKELRSNSGRPVQLVRDGRVLCQLF